MSTVSQVSRCCRVLWPKLELDSCSELREVGGPTVYYPAVMYGLGVIGPLQFLGFSAMAKIVIVQLDQFPNERL